MDRSQPLDPTAAIGPLFELPPPRRRPPKFKNPLHPVWSENKAHFVARYLQYFVFVTKHGTYIDGFAGPQPERETEFQGVRSQTEFGNERNEPFVLSTFSSVFS